MLRQPSPKLDLYTRVFCFGAASAGCDMPKSFEMPPTRKQRIVQLHKNTGAKFAVFCRSESGQNAKFLVVHKTLKDAIEAARTHAADLAGGGVYDFTYYAIEIKHRVGIEHGKVVDTPV